MRKHLISVVVVGVLWLITTTLIQMGHRLIPDNVFSLWVFVQLFDFVIEIDNSFLKIDEYILLGWPVSWLALVFTNFGLAGILKYVDQKSDKVEIVAMVAVIALITLWFRVNLGAFIYAPSLMLFFWRKARKESPIFLEYLLLSWALIVMV